MTETTATQSPEVPIAKKDNVLGSEGTSTDSTTSGTTTPKKRVTFANEISTTSEFENDGESVSSEGSEGLEASEESESEDSEPKTAKQVMDDFLETLGRENRPPTDLEMRLIGEYERLASDFIIMKARAAKDNSVSDALISTLMNGNAQLKQNERRVQNCIRQINWDREYWERETKKRRMDIEKLKERNDKLETERRDFVSKLLVLNTQKDTLQKMVDDGDRAQEDLLEKVAEQEQYVELFENRYWHRHAMLKKADDFIKVLVNFIYKHKMVRKPAELPPGEPLDEDSVKDLIERTKTLEVYTDEKIVTRPWLWNPDANPGNTRQTVTPLPGAGEPFYEQQMAAKHGENGEWKSYNNLPETEHNKWDMLGMLVYYEYTTQVLNGWITTPSRR